MRQRQPLQSNDPSRASSTANVTTGSSNLAPLLDSDDQQELLSNLAKEMNDQDKIIQQAFAVVCIGSALLSILAAVWLDDDAAAVSWKSPPVLMAAALHIVSYAHIHTASQNHDHFLPTPTRFVVCLGWFALLSCTSVALFLLRTNSNNNNNKAVPFYQALLLANTLTTGVALWLRADAAATQQSWKELQAAQYKYKSL